MLPFMKPKNIASVIVAKRHPEEGAIRTEETPIHDPGILAAAEDLIRAIHSKDIHAAAEAMHAAFSIMDAMPHEEGPHEGEE